MGEPRPNVLVIDNSQGAVSSLEALLSREELRVDSVTDGAAAVDAITSQLVDLVLLDVELPRLDGLAVLRALRSTPGRRYLPVMVLSAKEDRQLRIAAFEQGADDFVLKPWDDEELLARIRRCLSTRRRFDDLLEQAERLHRLSVTDGLTQVANHRHFQERLRDEFRRAQRYDDPLALIVLDLDHFKSINDRFGHPTGDQALREVASSVRRAVRETDFVARYGGEEFAVLLPKTHLAGALTVAERVWHELSQLRVGPGGTVRLTASLGVSGYPNRSVISADQLLRTADDALYRAKREGRNKICLFQASLCLEQESRAG